MTRALIVGLSGVSLTAGERDFLADVQPAGIILFKRNCGDLDQIARLVGAAREAISGDALVLIDQEGGRVRRLRPPLWRELPGAAAYGRLYQRNPADACAAAQLVAHLTAVELRAIGIDTSCAPVLDLAVPGAHDIIGDRAYGAGPDQVAALGRAVCEGLLAGGVLPVIKHIPGHGRAHADSHFELPAVATSQAELERTDFAPFRALADMPVAMTAHVVFSSIDPDAPASTSARVTAEIVRGSIGFDGLLMSDDIDMRALTGPLDLRAGAVIAAGSDIALQCSGDLAHMQLAAKGARELAGQSLGRFERAVALTRRAQPVDLTAAEIALNGALQSTA